MKCPTCGEHTPDSWELLYVSSPTLAGTPITSLNFKPKYGFPGYVEIGWMTCANTDCRELIIRVVETSQKLESNLPERRVDGWLARPRSTHRHVDPLVPPAHRRDYLEAAAILDLSPRMSAVLSRRILADLLAKYADLEGFSLKAQIDRFISDTTQPRRLRENLHHLREIANFGAHTQTNDENEIIDVTREEAEWTLQIIDGLFDFFIVAPEKDKTIREAFDAKLTDAGRKPIEPLPDDEPPAEPEGD